MNNPKTKDPAQLKVQIDSMNQFELCYKWRFAKCGDPFFQGEVGDYFEAKLKERGGFTPEISKQLGFSQD